VPQASALKGRKAAIYPLQGWQRRMQETAKRIDGACAAVETETDVLFDGRDALSIVIRD